MDEITREVYAYQTRYKAGFTDNEIQQLLNCSFPQCNQEFFNKYLLGVTMTCSICMTEKQIEMFLNYYQDSNDTDNDTDIKITKSLRNLSSFNFEETISQLGVIMSKSEQWITETIHDILVNTKAVYDNITYHVDIVEAIRYGIRHS